MTAPDLVMLFIVWLLLQTPSHGLKNRTSGDVANPVLEARYQEQRAKLDARFAHRPRPVDVEYGIPLLDEELHMQEPTEAERAAYARGRADAFEEAAKVCEEWGRGHFGAVVDRAFTSQEFAQRIRALARAAEPHESGVNP